MRIEDICKKYGIAFYTINPDGSIDVSSNVSLAYNNLTKLPLKFNKVIGFFDCSYNNLTNLEGCPNYVGMHFDCANNQLTSLEGSPNYIGGHFSCRYNPLPKEIIDNPKAELLRLQRESKINSLLDEY
jgi:hypothetical protein